jgi:hypothetical protein
VSEFLQEKMNRNVKKSRNNFIGIFSIKIMKNHATVTRSLKKDDFLVLDLW